jgi:hypothetical protein
MKKNFVVISAFLCTIALINSCQKNKLDALPFFEVFTRPLTGRLESVTLRGEVVGLAENIRPDVVLSIIPI